MGLSSKASVVHDLERDKFYTITCIHYHNEAPIAESRIVLQVTGEVTSPRRSTIQLLLTPGACMSLTAVIGGALSLHKIYTHLSSTASKDEPKHREFG